MEKSGKNSLQMWCWLGKCRCSLQWSFHENVSWQQHC